MDWEIDYSDLPIFIRVSTAGNVSLEDNHALWSELLASEKWKPGTSVMIESGALRPPGSDGYNIIHETANFFAANADVIGNTCLAIVRETPEQYNYISQFQYAARLRGSSIVVRTFSDVQTAVDWLITISEQTDQSSEEKSSVQSSG